jgi:hypothetical protein
LNLGRHQVVLLDRCDERVVDYMGDSTASV